MYVIFLLTLDPWKHYSLNEIVIMFFIYKSSYSYFFVYCMCMDLFFLSFIFTSSFSTYRNCIFKQLFNKINLDTYARILAHRNLLQRTFWLLIHCRGLQGNNYFLEPLLLCAFIILAPCRVCVKYYNVDTFVGFIL